MVTDFKASLTNKPETAKNKDKGKKNEESDPLPDDCRLTDW